jgi:hypothetical protein
VGETSTLATPSSESTLTSKTTSDGSVAQVSLDAARKEAKKKALLATMKKQEHDYNANLAEYKKLLE